jgi:hypothetical protein
VNPLKGSFTKPGNARKIKANRSMNCLRSVWGFSCQSPGPKVIAYGAISSDQGKQQNEFTRVKFRRAIITKKILSTTFEWVRIAVKKQALEGNRWEKSLPLNAAVIKELLSVVDQL